MKWYRYVDWATAPMVDEYDHQIGIGGVHVHCEQYQVIKETKCGVWLYVHEQRRWASKTSRKRFACPTKEEALESFRARKRKQASIYRARAAYADRALAFAEQEFGFDAKSAAEELERLIA